MVEAIYEPSPSEFKQFQKQFRFRIVDQNPTDISLINYAVCPHFESEFCQMPINVLIDSSIFFGMWCTKQSKSFAIPCLFTTFKILYSKSSKLETNADTFTKLKLAFGFNDKTREKSDPATDRKRLPISFSTTAKMLTMKKTTATKTSTTVTAQKTIHNTFSTATSYEQTQIEQICTETLKRVGNILRGPHSEVLCKVMDIFLSGCGKLDIDSELLFVRLVFEKKINFL